MKVKDCREIIDLIEEAPDNIDISIYRTCFGGYIYEEGLNYRKYNYRRGNHNDPDILIDSGNSKELSLKYNNALSENYKVRLFLNTHSIEDLLNDTYKEPIYCNMQRCCADMTPNSLLDLKDQLWIGSHKTECKVCMINHCKRYVLFDKR